ncbi:MAG: DUF2779 domain-containing protein [Bacteroidota bacterium]
MLESITHRFLTKSRFLLGLDCPTKLFYTGKEQYPNKNSENEFLEALAKGGYQVGALAKCYYPEGNDIETLDYAQAVEQTNKILQQENVTVFEAAIQVNRFFVRVDILEKRGDIINLIEVKSKSFSGDSSLDMLNRGGYIDTRWKPYVYDVAFQKYVLTLSKPEWEVNAFLMLADKNATTNVDGLNQKFLLRAQANERTSVEYVGDVTPEGLGNEILTRVNVDDLCQMIFEGVDSKEPLPMPFGDYAAFLADYYWDDKKINMPIHKDCGNCEFRTTTAEEQEGKVSGFKECWTHQLGWAGPEFAKPLIFDIWDFRRKPELMEQGIFHMDHVRPEHIGEDAENNSPKLTRQSRQWLQVHRTVTNEPDPYIDVDGLKQEMSTWKFPLHMIDFETSTVAVPLYKGLRPYESIAFQFSHHIIHEGGSIEHLPEYLNVERGHFPNFDLVRSLRDQLSKDDGSVFRYATHENTILNHIMTQLQIADDVPDKQELIDFIKTITHSANHTGDRDMIDLLEVVKFHYWHPLMKGSNSLKVVLPAILNSSEHIREKYSSPIYGQHSEIRSQNYEDGWIWIQNDEKGEVINPYDLLPSLIENLDQENVEEFLMGDRLADGGAAMTAYAMMQFTEMSHVERERIIQGLLRYCELDTMAMVFLWEGWQAIN